MYKRNPFGLQAAFKRRTIIIVGMIPFVVVIGAYLIGSDIRLAVNPADKLMPSLGQIWDTAVRYAAVPDVRTGSLLLWSDWLASMTRMVLGVGASAFVALFLGLHAGLFPVVRTAAIPFVTFMSIVPPLAILPILFIIFGVDEFGKIALIFLGTVWFITRDMYQYVRAIPKEQTIKSLTLGASALRTAYSVILPQVLPRLIDSVRLSLGAAWLFLIAAEAIASDAGLGYRIFLVRRYLAMDAIIPYVVVITATGFVMDWCLRTVLRLGFRWYTETKE